MIKIFPLKVTAKKYCDLREILASNDSDLFGSSCLMIAWIFIFSWVAGAVFDYLEKDNILHLCILLNGFLLFIISLTQHLISDNFNLLFTIIPDKNSNQKYEN